MGADIDVRALVDEIRAEISRKAAAGLYPADLLADPRVADPDRLRVTLAAAREAGDFSVDVPISSHRRVAGPWIVRVKRLMLRGLRWYFLALASRFRTFGTNVVNATELLAERVADVESELPRIREKLTRIERNLRERRGDAPSAGPAPAASASAGHRDAGNRGQSWGADWSIDYLDFEHRFRGSTQEIASSQRKYVSLFGRSRGRVLDLGCGRGEFLALLREAAIDAYGVDRYPDMVTYCRDRGLEVVEQELLAHLAAVPAASLGGLSALQVLEHLDPPQVVRFFQLAADALAKGSTLLVETINPQSLFVFAHALYVDLGHLKPLHPLTLQWLAEAVGFSDVRVEYFEPVPDEYHPQELPRVGDEAFNRLVDQLNENFRRIDRTLFGPQDFALIARR